MKTLRLVALGLCLAATPARAAPETLEEYLVRVELEHASVLARGLSNNHPEVLRLAAALNLLRADPKVEAAEYRELLAKKRSILNVQLAEFRASGLGDGHPDVVGIKAQLDLIEKRLRPKN